MLCGLLGNGRTMPDLFQLLPNEVILMVMAAMTLKDRLSLLEAYPRLEEFGQSPALKTRVPTLESVMSKKELRRVLDMEGKDIRISVDCLGFKLVLKVVRLMPHLQEVTLKSCTFRISNCTKKTCCYSITGSHKAILDCRAWKALATRVKCLTIDSCETQRKDDIEKFKRCWRYLFLNYFFTLDPGNTFEKIIFKNTEISFTFIGDYRIYRIMTAVVKNLAGESLNLRDFVPPHHDIFETTFQIYMFLTLFCPDDQIGKPCRMIEIKRHRGLLAHVKMTVDFDMDKMMLKIGKMQDRLRHRETYS